MVSLYFKQFISSVHFNKKDVSETCLTSAASTTASTCLVNEVSDRLGHIETGVLEHMDQLALGNALLHLVEQTRPAKDFIFSLRILVF